MSDPLHPKAAREKLSALGRLLYDADPKSLWERDTATLPKRLQRLRRSYRDFAESHLAPRALAAEHDITDDELRRLFLASARRGFQTSLLPKPLGSMSPRSLLGELIWPAVLKAEEFSAACSGLGLALQAHDLGIGPLLLSGDVRGIRWQRHIYRQIEAGEPAFAAFAITEPGAGSDVEDTEGAATARLSTRARRVDGGWRISGSKCFISNARVARWITLFAALEGRGVESWTCFLLDAGMSGLTVGRSERKMGQKAADASELLLDDVLVPDDRVIGPLEAGWAINRNVLNYSRPGVGAIALGIARNAFEHALAFCHRTRLSGKPLVAYQEVGLRLAHMLTRIQAGRALAWQTARYLVPFQAAGAMAKSFCGDMAWEVATDAMALLGDHGYLHAQGVEKATRDARLTQIYEGTNQINRLAVLEGQGGAEFEMD